jgi:hypothetical protein
MRLRKRGFIEINCSVANKVRKHLERFSFDVIPRADNVFSVHNCMQVLLMNKWFGGKMKFIAEKE